MFAVYFEKNASNCSFSSDAIVLPCDIFLTMPSNLSWSGIFCTTPSTPPDIFFMIVEKYSTNFSLSSLSIETPLSFIFVSISAKFTCSGNFSMLILILFGTLSMFFVKYSVNSSIIFIIY